MANYTFNDDLPVGKKGEQIVRFDLESEGAKYLGDNDNDKFDINMLMPNGQEVTFEVKTDVLCEPHKDTNNLFIEVESWNKAGGVDATVADIFAYYYPHLKEIWYIKTSKLLDLIENNDFRLVTEAGDKGSGTKGYLIPRYPYKKHFKVRTVQKGVWQN
jgi:hypothetical protein